MFKLYGLYVYIEEVTYNLYNKLILSSSQVIELVNSGWFKADLHVHTCCSHDTPGWKSLHPQVIYNKAVSLGMNYITFTDHDNIKAFDLLDKTENLVSGVELSIKDTENVGHTLHINIFDFEKTQFNEMYHIAANKKDLFQLFDYFKDNDLPYVYNHPFGFISNETPNLSAIPEIAKHFPIIEYNVQDLKYKNRYASELANKLNKGMIIATDTHTGNIGAAYTIAKGDDFRTYYKNICEGKCKLVMDSTSLRYLSREISTWVELAFNMDKEMDLEFFTGVSKVDAALRLLDTKLFSYNLFSKITMKSIQTLSLSGIPVLLYMLSTKYSLSEVDTLIANI